MRMGFELNPRIHTAANILNERSQLAQRTIVPDPDHRDAPAAEVRHHHEFPGLIHRDEAGAGAAGWDGIQQTQLATRCINGKRADVRRMIERWTNGERILAYRVEESMIRRNSQERRVDHLRCQFGLTKLAGSRAE